MANSLSSPTYVANNKEMLLTLDSYTSINMFILFFYFFFEVETIRLGFTLCKSETRVEQAHRLVIDRANKGFLC